MNGHPPPDAAPAGHEWVCSECGRHSVDKQELRQAPMTATLIVTREHWIEIYGGGSYRRGLEWLREEGLCVVPSTAEGDFGWKAERKPV